MRTIYSLVSIYIISLAHDKIYAPETCLVWIMYYIFLSLFTSIIMNILILFLIWVRHMAKLFVGFQCTMERDGEFIQNSGHSHCMHVLLIEVWITPYFNISKRMQLNSVCLRLKSKLKHIICCTLITLHTKVIHVHVRWFSYYVGEGMGVQILAATGLSRKNR